MTALLDRLLLTTIQFASMVLAPRPHLILLLKSRGWPSSAAPKTETDKFLWRKLFDHNPLFTMACDKLAAKDYALKLVPELKTARVIWSGTNLDELPAEALEGDVVFKANHGSGWNVLVRKENADIEELKATGRRWVSRTFGWRHSQWGYINARRMVLVEEMLLDENGPVATEYKVHVSAGLTSYVYIKKDAPTGRDWAAFDRSGELIVESSGSDIAANLPAQFGKLVEMGEVLGASFDYIRVDFYLIRDEIYFSELTAYPMAGFTAFYPRLIYLRNAGWDIRNSWFLASPQTGWRRHYAAALRRWVDQQSSPKKVNGVHLFDRQT